MGQRGPQSTDSNVVALRGNPGHRPNVNLLDEFKPEIELPNCPPYLWAEAKAEWERIGPELVKYGLIANLDRAALALYCQAWAKMVWAEEQLAASMAKAAAGRAEAEASGKEWTGGDGFMLPTPNGGFAYSPHWVMSNKAGAEVAKYLEAFGLSPATRSRVSRSDNRQASLPLEGGGENKWDSL